MVDTVSRAELEAAHCWLDHDEVKSDPALTAFRRNLRLHHSQWREKLGYPIGTHRVRPGTKPRPIGSHLDIDFARESAATFLTARARRAAEARASIVEPHQIFNQQSFWADLMSSEALAVNLFGDLASDLDRADRAVRTWWPSTPGRVVEVRFAHSPGRLDPSYSNSRRFFDAMFVLELPDGSSGALAIDTTYREVFDRKGVKAAHLPRFNEIHDRSAAFARGSADLLPRSRCSMIWLEHLLLLSMLQHESQSWSWGRYVVIHPADNTDASSAVREYHEHLDDDSTFASTTLETLLATKVLAPKTGAALRRRYLLP
jgi:hypothetical protein